MARGKLERLRRPGVVGTGVLALVAGLVTLGTPAQASTIGGLFELDGNAQMGSAVGDDWETLHNSTADDEGAAFVAKTAMPIVDEDADLGVDVSFYTGGGSKDVRPLADWRHSSSDVAPDKDEILNAFAAAYRYDTDDAGTDEELIVFFGADRFANDGDAQMGFWFFKNAVSLNSDGTFNGSHTAAVPDNPATIGVNEATGGDLLVLSDFSGGGKVSTIKVYEWWGGKDPLRQLSFGAGSPDCGDTNHPADLCATENASPGGQAALWDYMPKSGTSNKYPTGSFLEGGINVSHLVAGTDSCFASFLAETRSSTSTTAQLKDFALGRFPVCDPSTTLTAAADTSGPDITTPQLYSGGSATFTFTEENDGDIPLSSVSVSTDQTSGGCATTASVLGADEAEGEEGPTSDSTHNVGDLNNNAMLDPGEEWTFSCTVTSVTEDLTVTGTGHGLDPRGYDATYVDGCTDGAVVAIPDTDPVRYYVCTPSEQDSASVDVIAPSTDMSATAATADPAIVHSDEDVDLTFYEMNDGDVPLTDVVVSSTNDACQDSMEGAYVPDDESTEGVDEESFNEGDANSDGVLDPDEEWVFTCTTSSDAAGSTVTVEAFGHGTDPLGNDVSWYETGTGEEAVVCADGEVDDQLDLLCDTTERTTASFDVINPSTTLTLTASALVTYTFAETNDGNGDITNVAVEDEDGICDSGPTATLQEDDASTTELDESTLNIGDTNDDGVLNTGETWVFTCTATVTGSAPAEGEDVGTTLTGDAVGTGDDGAGDEVTWCENEAAPPTDTTCSQGEKDSVTVTITQHVGVNDQ